MLRRTYFSSNRNGAAAEIVQADERLEILRTDWQREKKPYRLKITSCKQNSTTLTPLVP